MLAFSRFDMNGRVGYDDDATRTRTLDGTLRGKFEQWYPSMKSDVEDRMTA